jgi:6-phosphogluconolactonase
MFVYVSSADDGDIGLYHLGDDGRLEARGRFKAAPTVMPMAASPDGRFLIAAMRSPAAAMTFSIGRESGALEAVGSGPLADSFPYIHLDATGRFLLCASYGAHLVSVSPVGENGVVGAPLQVIPTARHAHAIVTDRSNRFAFVPHLGTDQVFQFAFDPRSGRLAASTPPVLQLAQGTGPRHLVVSGDNRFVFVLNELTATVTTLAHKDGLLKEVASASVLAPGSKLFPGAPRPTPGRDVSNDIWASDLHLSPDGRFLYAAERTGSTLGVMRVDKATGKLGYLGSTPTEKQPRGFRIDPTGRFLVASGEKSDTISSYAIDPSSGALKLVGKAPTGKGSNWVVIVD